MEIIKFCQIDLFSNVDIAFKFDVITNLTCYELILKIVQSSFIYRFIQLTHGYHALKTCLTQINVLIDNVQTYEWTNVIGISYLLINPCFKCVFNAWYQCVKHKNYEWKNFAQFSLLNRLMLSLWWYFIPSIFWPHHGVVNKFEYHNLGLVSTFTKNKNKKINLF
jgi:hypothetical protein